MAMLATLEGPEVAESDDYILGRMFEPNDGLGCELLGVDGWNYAKGKVANAARNALKNKRLFIVPEIIYCDQMDKPLDMGMVQLFGIDIDYSTELLGKNIVKYLTDTAKNAISAVHKAGVSSTRKAAKNVWNEVKKQTKDPFYAAKVAISPTLQTRAISKSDPTGISTKLFEKTYKFAPDVLPNLAIDKATKESIKLDPTGVSQTLYKMGQKGKDVVKTTTPGGAYDYYSRQQKKAQEKAQAEEISNRIKAEREQKIKELKEYSDYKKSKAQSGVSTSTGAATNQEPQIIYQQIPGTTQYVPVTTETPGFDWSGLLNWKTALLAGGIAYFVFGRRARGGKKR